MLGWIPVGSQPKCVVDSCTRYFLEPRNLVITGSSKLLLFIINELDQFNKIMVLNVVSSVGFGITMYLVLICDDLPLLTCVVWVIAITPSVADNGTLKDL